MGPSDLEFRYHVDRPLAQLHEALANDVAEWRAAGYPSSKYAAISEILDFARDPETSSLRYLRAHQLAALETYWYELPAPKDATSVAVKIIDMLGEEVLTVENV